MINLDEMRKLAEAASPGPWKIGYADGSGGYDEEQGKFCLTDSNDSCVLHARLCDSVFDAKFIARANPATVLALLDVVEAARRCADRGYPCPHCDLGYEEDTCSCFDSISEKKEHIAGLKDALARLDGKEQ